jgi:hypothetical protein
MPSTVKVRIHGARNLYLPYSDVYTTVTLGGHAGIISEYDESDNNNDPNLSNPTTSTSYYKQQNINTNKNKRKYYTARTRVTRKLNSSSVVKWEDDNEFRFEVVDDTLLQDEPLIFKVLESEGGCVSGGGSSGTAGGGGGASGGGGGGENGSIGLVYIDLNPLLMKCVILSDEKNEEKKKNVMDRNVVDMRIDEEGGGGGGDREEKKGTNNTTANNTLTSPRINDSHSRKERKHSRSGSMSHDDKGKSSSGSGSSSSGGVIDGWFPIYDPLEGVRGELGLSIKLNFIDNINPFRDSSAGVQLFPFSSFDMHSRYIVQHVFGFVEELVVAEDPEFEWNVGDGHMNNFRLARSSHERRQTLMYLLDASVRRRMCKKVLEMGGNAVLGYYQSFDMEGDSGIVARTYGTCVLIEKNREQHHHYLFNASSRMKHSITNGGISDHRRDATGFDDKEGGRNPVVGDSKGGDRQDDGGGSDGEVSEGGKMIIKNKHHLSEAAAAAARHRESEQDEVQLLTIKDFGRRVRVRIGGLVTARSVKYLGKLASKLSDQETRDGWWQELRDEIRSHARTLCCSHVIGYSEASTIHDDVCVLSLTGTAATVRGLPDLNKEQEIWMALERKISERNKKQKWMRQRPETGDSTPGGYFEPSYSIVGSDVELDESTRRKAISLDRNGELVGESDVQEQPMSRKMLRRKKHAERLEKRYLKFFQGKSNKSMKKTEEVDPLIGKSIFRARPARPCSYCHVPYHHKFAPFGNMKLVPCLLCGKKWVPEVILATVEPPARLPVRGSGVFIQARVCRTRPKSSGESDALAVSEALPFLEYEIARQLMLKLKVLGRNAAFSLKSEIDVGSQLIVGTCQKLAWLYLLFTCHSTHNYT